MSFIMVSVSNKKSIDSIRAFMKEYPDLFITQLNGKIFFMKNNGLSLALAMKLRTLHGGWVDVYIGDRVTKVHLPEKVKKVGQYLIEHSRGCSLETAVRKCGFTMEELKCQKIDYWPTSRRKQ